MTRVSRKWVLVLLIPLVWVAGELGLEALKDKRFVATVATGPSFISRVTSGPPLAVNSTEVVANLNADLLDGFHASDFNMGPPVNLQQVALLRWYEASQSGASFAVGSAPVATAFDGATLGAFAVGSNPQGVAFDGANIWVTNSSGTTVSKL